jgi:hypothetical protein
MWVEVVFMLVILKIPVLYLCGVVWWAVRSEPRPLEGARAPARLPEPDCPWRRRRPRTPRPHGALRRASARRARVAA